MIAVTPACRSRARARRRTGRTRRRPAPRPRAARAGRRAPSRRDPHGVHAAHLARADPDRGAAGGDHDRVGAHVAAHLPGEQQVLPLLLARAARRSSRASARASRRPRRGSARAARRSRASPSTSRSGAGQLGELEQAHVLLLPAAPRARRASKPGASSTSMNCLESACAQRDVDAAVERRSRRRRRSAGRTRRRARRRPGPSSAIAQPHGLLCLTIAHAGPSNSSTSSRAELRSSRLLNDSSLPCSCSHAVEQVRGRAHARRRRRRAGGGSRRSAGRVTFS